MFLVVGFFFVVYCLLGDAHHLILEKWASSSCDPLGHVKKMVRNSKRWYLPLYHSLGN